MSKYEEFLEYGKAYEDRLENDFSKLIELANEARKYEPLKVDDMMVKFKMRKSK